MTYKDVICKGYCRNYGGGKEVICGACGDFCDKFDQSDFASYMIGEELLEPVTTIYERYLTEQIKAFDEKQNTKTDRDADI